MANIFQSARSLLNKLDRDKEKEGFQLRNPDKRDKGFLGSVKDIQKSNFRAMRQLPKMSLDTKVRVPNKIAEPVQKTYRTLESTPPARYVKGRGEESARRIISGTESIKKPGLANKGIGALQLVSGGLSLTPAGQYREALVGIPTSLFSAGRKKIQGKEVDLGKELEKGVTGETSLGMAVSDNPTVQSIVDIVNMGLGLYKGGKFDLEQKYIDSVTNLPKDFKISKIDLDTAPKKTPVGTKYEHPAGPLFEWKGRISKRDKGVIGRIFAEAVDNGKVSKYDVEDIYALGDKHLKDVDVSRMKPEAVVTELYKHQFSPNSRFYFSELPEQNIKVEDLEAKRLSRVERLEAKTKKGFEPVSDLIDKNRYQQESFKTGSKLEYQSGRLSDKYGFERPFVRRLLSEYKPQKVERAMGYVEDSPNKVGSREGYVIDTLRTKFYTEAPNKAKLKGTQSEDYKIKKRIQEEVRKPQKPTEGKLKPDEPLKKIVSEDEFEYNDPSQLHSLDVKEAGKEIYEGDYFFENYRQRDTHLVTTKNRLYQKWNNPKETLSKLEDDFIDGDIQKREAVLEVITGKKTIKELDDKFSMSSKQIKGIKGTLEDMAYMQDLETRGRYKDEYFPRVFREAIEEKRLDDIFPESQLQASVKNLHHLEHKISDQLASDVRLDEALDYRINEGLFEIYGNKGVASSKVEQTPIEQLEGFLAKEISKASEKGKFKPDEPFEFFTKTQEKMDDLGFDVGSKELDYSYTSAENLKGDVNVMETIRTKGGEDIHSAYGKYNVSKFKDSAISQDLERIDEFQTPSQRAAFMSRVLQRHLGDDPKLAESLGADNILSAFEAGVSKDVLIKHLTNRYELNRIRDMSMVMAQYDVDGKTSDYFNDFLSSRVAMADIEKTWYRTLANGTKAVFSRAYLWASTTTGIRQPTEGLKAAAGATPKSMAKGFEAFTPSEVKRIKNVYGTGGDLSETEIAKLAEIKSSKLKGKGWKKVVKKLDDAGFWHIQKLEELKNVYMAKVFEEQGLRQGLEGDKLKAFVINSVNRFGNPHSIETRPNVLKGKPVRQLLFQFTEYSMKSFGTAWTTMQKGAYKEAAGLAAAEVANIAIISQLLGIPIGWATGYSFGTGPIVSFMKNTYNNVKGISEAKEEGTSPDYYKARLKKSLLKLHPGGAQRQRTMESHKAIKQGYATNLTGDRATFQAPQSLWQKFKAYAFGLHSTKQSRLYYKKGFRSLDEDLTKTLGSLTDSDVQDILVDDRERKRKIRKLKSKAESGKRIKDKDAVQGLYTYQDADGDWTVIDTAKINSMPDDNRGDRARKTHKAYLKIKGMVYSGVEDEKIQEVANSLGLDINDVKYYSRAAHTNDIKLEYVLDDIGKIVENEPDKTQAHKNLIQYLAMNRKEVAGKIMAADGVINDLYDMELITKSEKKRLKNLIYGEDGRIKTQVSGRGSGSKVDIDVVKSTKFTPKLTPISTLTKRRASKTSKPSQLFAKFNTGKVSSLYE